MKPYRIRRANRPAALAAALLLLASLAASCSPRGEPAPGAARGPAPAAAAPGPQAAASPGALPAPAAPAFSPGIEEIPLRGREAGRAGSPIAGFTDVTAETGILFQHRRGAFDAKLANIMPWISSIGAAAAASDYDRDGDDDLYVTSSRQGFPNALFRNDGGRFLEVGAEAGVAAVNGEDGVSMDAAFADLDNDGDDDLYVVAWGRDRLFRNDGGGKFTDITADSGTGDPGNGNCVLPFDLDGDGLLDLYVCNYFPPVNLMRVESTRIMHESFEAARNGGANVLYKNLGGLRFADVARELHVDDTGWSLDAGLSDIDNDGDADLYVANDFGQDKVYLANGDGTFTDATERAIGHETFKGMNIDFGDFNNDGFTDGYVANITTAEFLKEGNMLLLNGGNGAFTNVAAATGTFDGGWGWCGRFLDFDGDGHLDILTVNGFVTAGPENYWSDLANIAVDPQFDPADAAQWPAMGAQSLSGNEPARLFRNRADGSFEEVAKKYGIADRRDGRGIALLDFDEDGDLDAYIANQDAPGALYRNDVGNAHRFLILSLAGTRSNRSAIGARVQATVASEGRTLKLTREVNGVNGYASQSSLRLHFGLGMAENVERLTVFWPSGIVQDFRDLPVDRHLRITESGEPMPREERQALCFATAREGGVAAPAVAGEGRAPGASPAVLLELEEKLRRKPCNAPLANRYRMACVDGQHFDRSINFFRGLVREHAKHPALRLQLALALVDKIPFLEGDVLAQGSLAKESLNELRWVEEAAPNSYALHYVSGMNHLYWPDSLKHYDDAVRHFERALAVAKARLAAGAAAEPHHAEVYRALGDAHVKAKRFEAARALWKEGLALFPGREGLASRLALPDDEAARAVKDERGLKRRIDSNLAWLAEENGLAMAERAIAERPDDRALLNDYRLQAFELDRSARAVETLESLAAAHPALAEPRLHLALALADQVSAIGSATPEVHRLAARLLDEVAAYSKLAPTAWLGPYVEGLCHLFRPRSAESAAAAARALEESARLARKADGSPRVPYPWIALGDAHALKGDAAAARAAWEEVRERWPRARGLKARLEAAPLSIAGAARAEYDLGRGIPTDLEALADREGEIAALEDALRGRVTRAAADRYRRLVRGGEDPGRAIQFLAQMVAAQPRSANARVQLAFALIDRTPDQELGSVRKGLLSSQALQALEEAAAAHPDRWGLHYVIGLVHLNWFTKLQHVPYAIESFGRCLALQKGREAERPYHVLVYQALGDAIVKEHDFARGRRVWKDGQGFFPDDKGLAERMGLTALMVNRYVEEERSWAAVEDTAKLSEVIGDLPDMAEAPPPPGAAARSG